MAIPKVWKDKGGKLRAIKCGCNTGGKYKFNEESRGSKFTTGKMQDVRCPICQQYFYYTTKKVGA